MMVFVIQLTICNCKIKYSVLTVCVTNGIYDKKNDTYCLHLQLVNVITVPNC